MVPILGLGLGFQLGSVIFNYSLFHYSMVARVRPTVILWQAWAK